MRISCVFVVVLLCMLKESHQQSIDIGSCACSCGQDNDHSSPAISSSRRGIPGPPGKQGPAGPAGPSGSRGLPGSSGRGGGISGSIGTITNPGSSCNDIRRQGVTDDGVYYIRVTPQSSTFQVYCDMTSTGSNGWTLVASIHENNLRGHCTIGDKWSSEQGCGVNASGILLGSTSWENTDVFGDVESATSADYKNPAYFNLRSSNLMVWNVPVNTPLERWKQESSIAYATDNGFLSRYGSTLRSLFNDHYPLRKFPDKVTSVVGGLVDIVSNAASNVRSQIPNFFEYSYDCTGEDISCISDGGSDLFDNGNKLQYSVNGASLSPEMVYGRTYTDPSGVEMITWQGHPFVALALFNNVHGHITFKLKVTSNMGADGSGSVTTYSGSVDLGPTTVHYRANEVYGAGDPSCAQVFFHQEPLGGSRVTVDTPDWENSNTNALVDSYVISGRLGGTIAGYMLLAKSSDTRISSSEIQRAVTELMRPLVSAARMPPSPCSTEEDTLAVPVTFIKESSSGLASLLPPMDRDNFESGYFHFRAFDSFGLPRAFCPGVKSTGCSPQNLCLGGINTCRYNQETRCGDFVSNVGGAQVHTSVLIFYGN